MYLRINLWDALKGIVCKDAMTQVVYVLLMKGELLGSGLSAPVYDCDICVVVSDQPEDIGWGLYKEQDGINSLVSQIM